MNLASTSRLAELTALMFALAAGNAHAASVIMISVDGMKPEYVLEASTRQLKLPFLTSLMANGAFATEVTGVWPTVTYPSHTTLVTGVTPAEHGIYNNLEFDPNRRFSDSWFWYAAAIKVPTLWQAAHRTGVRTASVGWPVTVGNSDIDFLIPEYWRISRPTGDLNPSDRHLIAALSQPAGMLDELQQSVGPYLMGNDTSLQADETKTRFAVEILRSHKPGFMTVHLSSLDEAEHEFAPFSATANSTLEAIDGMLARLALAARASDPAAIVVVVSDHGFVNLTHRVNLYIPFLQAGFIEGVIDPKSDALAVKAWTAQPWLAGGMAAIVLRNPEDRRVAAQVRELLGQLEADANNGIDEILERDAMDKRGAFPGASFLVVMKATFYLGTAVSGPVSIEKSGGGGHGFSPDLPSMQSAFFVVGTGIAAHRNLGRIDMRQIAPTVAGLLNIGLPSATAAALPVRQ